MHICNIKMKRNNNAMETLLLLLKFSGAIILLFILGLCIGHFLKLDKKYEEMREGFNTKYHKK